MMKGQTKGKYIHACNIIHVFPNDAQLRTSKLAWHLSHVGSNTQRPEKIVDLKDCVGIIGQIWTSSAMSTLR